MDVKQYLINVCTELVDLRPCDKQREHAVVGFKTMCEDCGFDPYLIFWKVKMSRKINRAYTKRTI